MEEIESMTKKNAKSVEDAMAEAKLKIQAIDKAGLTGRARQAGVMGAILGVSNEALMEGITAGANADMHEKALATTPRQQAFEGYTPIEKKIAQMLTEDTGVDMMDSGGENGRHWQMNRLVKDFRIRPKVNIETYVSEHVKEHVKEPARLMPKLMTKHMRLRIPLMQKPRATITTPIQTMSTPIIPVITKETAITAIEKPIIPDTTITKLPMPKKRKQPKEEHGRERLRA